MLSSLLTRLATLHPKVIDLSLNRVRRLLKALNKPHTALPPVVHVAGTNGKGSVIGYLQAFLEAAGLTVHSYTSPHLVHFNERIRIAGKVISDSALIELLTEVEQVNAGQLITLFEITTCAAILGFSRKRADVVLLETGLGGRLDATNVIQKPALTILTPIAMDHMHYLGNRVEDIAAEKSHILKPGVGCVVAKQERKVTNVIELRSLTTGSPIWREGDAWHVYTRNNQILFEGIRGTLQLPMPALVGNFQVRNAGLSIAAVERLPFTVTADHIATGLRTVVWPGRLQLLISGPLVNKVPSGWEIWVDGGHNPSAAVVISRHVRQWRERPLVLVLGMLNTKDANGFIKAILPRVTFIRTVTIPNQQSSLSADALALIAKSLGHPDVSASKSVSDALEEVINRCVVPGRILITGSLYLVGSILSENS